MEQELHLAWQSRNAKQPNQLYRKLLNRLDKWVNLNHYTFTTDVTTNCYSHPQCWTVVQIKPIVALPGIMERKVRVT